ncbi:MAG: cysteine hydrolase [Beijerinckiaceae bacterium]|nr:cysteine hydrolase [Beijerinckiaceae bacterium]
MFHAESVVDHAVTRSEIRSTALVMIEFQREWLDPAVGKLNSLVADKTALRASADAAKRLLAAARAAAIRIVHVPCLHDAGYPEIAGGLAHGLFAAIPRARTWIDAGRPFADGFEPGPGEFVVSGRVGASAFAHSNLDIHLRAHNIKRLIIAGYALHVCVESTLRQAHDLGYDATIAEDACASFTDAQRRHVLEDVVHHFGRAASVGDLERALKAA